MDNNVRVICQVGTGSAQNLHIYSKHTFSTLVDQLKNLPSGALYYYYMALLYHGYTQHSTLLHLFHTTCKI